MDIRVQVSSTRAAHDFEAHATVRLRRALHGLGDAVNRVDVDIGDIRGSRAGADTYCRMRVHGPGLDPFRGGTVNVFKGAEGPEAAVSAAVDRMVRAVERRIAAPEQRRAA